MIAWQRNPQARLRRTSKGGAAFLPATVTTAELDDEAFAALASLSCSQTARELRRQLIPRFNRNFTIAEIEILLRDLAEQQFVIESAGEALNPIHPEKMPLAPESVHLQLNNVCNLRCPSCYVGLHAEEGPGTLSLDRIQSLIDEWAGMGVFQLALGGGEPLLSPKFVPVARYARARGIVPNATTNGWLITEELIDEVADSLGELRLSLNDALSINKELFEEKATLLRARELRFGFNLIVTRQNLDQLPEWLRWGCEQGAATINLIRPKPAPGNDRWYEQNRLSSQDASRLAQMLPEIKPLFSKTNLSIDCAFSFLFHGWPAHTLQARGVAGCALGDRFATVKWNGDVSPCSHLHGEEFTAGNVLEKSFQEIWEAGSVFGRLRKELDQVEGHCGGCGFNTYCKGCRAVMKQQTGNWLAADQDCPQKP